MLRRPGRFAVVAAAAAAAVSSALVARPSSGRAAEAVPPPEADPFYQQPSPMPAAPPGSILRSRQIAVDAVGIALPVTAWQLLYVTADAHGEPEATVATILLPFVPAAPGHPLVSYQTAEDSLATHCAPSYTLREGTEKEEPMVLSLLERGWTVVVPDYEGPGSAFGAGVQAGHGVLDGIRAAERFAPARLDGAATPVGLWGYSGGGLASAWAAELQPTYAPELNVRGSAQGGVTRDVGVVARNIDGTAFMGIYLLAAVGISRAYPAEIDINSLLNANGRAMLEDVGHDCLSDAVAKYAFHRMSEYTVVDPLTVPRVEAVIATDRLGQRVPSVALYVYHSIPDEIIPIAGTDSLVGTYCSEGVTVDYHRDLLSEHISLAATGAPAALSYLTDRFAGKPPPTTC